MYRKKANKETVDCVTNNNSLLPPKALNLTGNVFLNYCEFEENFRNYMKATGFTDLNEQKKINILLRVIGYDTRKIIIAHKLYGETMERVLKHLKNHFGKRNTTIMHRYKMFLAAQEENETVEEYVSRLNFLAKPCEFGAEEENQIRDRLVFGLKSKKWRDNILKESKISLKEVIKWCSSWEMLDNQLKEAKIKDKQGEIVKNGDKVNVCKGKFKCGKCGHLHGLKDCPAFGATCFICKKLNHFGKYCKYKILHLPPKSLTCARCGLFHEFKECPAYGKTCLNCFKLNHFASECKMKKTINEAPNKDEQLPLNEFKPFNEVTNGLIKNNWNAILKIENDDMCEFKLDTRSDINIIPFNLYKTFKCFDETKINQLQLRLLSFGNDGIDMVGFVDLCCTTGDDDNYQVIRFCLINNADYCMLGLQACISLNLIRQVELPYSWNQFWDRNFESNESW